MYLPEKPEWTEGVYQIEVNDDILGDDGVVVEFEEIGGPDNKPLLDLACRTSYLRTIIGTIKEVA